MKVYHPTGEFVKKTFLYILLITFLIAALMRIGTATPATTMSVEPSSIVDEALVVGSVFSVDIVVSNVTNLGGYEFKLGYDLSILTVTSVVVVNETNFFYDCFVWTKQVVAVGPTEAYVWLVVTLPLGTLEGVDGTGTVVTVDFAVDDVGETPLDLYDTLLGDPLAVPMAHVAVDGYFSNFPAQRSPVANFVYSPAMPLVDQTVTFNASASVDPDGTIDSYNWDFGDGATDTGMMVNHTFAAAGTYTVNLTITDNDSLTDWATTDVEVILPAVHDVAVISVTASESSVSAGEEVSISVTVRNEGTRSETFSVTVSYDSQVGTSQTVFNLGQGSERTLTFDWDTSGVEPASYTIKAVASKVAGETDEIDNTGFSDPVSVTAASTGTPLIYYVAVAGAIIAVVAAAAYFIKVRKH